MLLFAVMFCLLVALGLGLCAAISDARGLTIPNIYPLGVALAFVPAYGLCLIFAPDSGYFQSVLSHLGAFALVFAVSFALFHFKLFGGGDSKLCSAFALWTGVQGLSAFVFYMAVTGGLLGLFALLLRKRPLFQNAREGGWIDRLQKGENAVPYGIAITLGAAASFVWLGYLAPSNLHALAGGR